MAEQDMVLATLVKTTVMQALKDALDWETPLAVELVSALKKKMNPVTSDTAASDPKIEADARVKQLTQDLDVCSSPTRGRFIDMLMDLDLVTENRVDELINESLDHKLDDYCDEDKVRDIVNGAWNGA